MNKVSHVFTLQTRLDEHLSSDSLLHLDNYAALFSRLSRLYFSQWRKSGFNPKSCPKKPEFMALHRISGRQFNAIKRSVEGMVDSQFSNLTNYLADNQAKQSGLLKRIEKNKKRILHHRARASHPMLSTSKRALAKENEQNKIVVHQQLHRRLQRLKARERALERQIKSKDLSVCFGTKKRFHAQHHLSENGYRSLAQWREDWRKAEIINSLS